VTIPEEGDTIMLGFEYGNPSRPYVAGSIFTEKTGAGGGAGNKSKSLTTRSGSTVTLDDDKGNVLIADQTGDDNIFVDGAGNIEINSTETITLTCGESTVTLNKAGEISINGKKIYTSGADEVNIGSGGESASSGISINPDNVEVGASSDINIGSNANVNIGSSNIAIGAEGGEVVVQGTKINLN
jgi:uncharacterized protein involved in type VI secretion and phage assembly